MKLSLASVLAAAVAVSAQVSESYTDQHGITYQAITHYESGTIFGLALPLEPTDEFIGQITTKIENGWVGVSFGGGMVNNLLWVGWPDVATKTITGAFRLAQGYYGPEEFTTPGPVMTPIYTDSAVNETHMTHTFVCKNCHKWLLPDGYEQSFDLAGDFAVLGYAGHTEIKPFEPENKVSEIYQHNFFGQFGMMLLDARNENYEAWKAAGLDGPSTTEPVSTATPTSTETETSTPTPTSSDVPIPTLPTTTYIPAISTISSVTSVTSSVPKPTPIIPSGVPKWHQCGGYGYKGTNKCVRGTRCFKVNVYYSHCL